MSEEVQNRSGWSWTHVVHVKDVAEGHEGSEEVASGRVDNTLGLKAETVQDRARDRNRVQLTFPVLPDV